MTYTETLAYLFSQLPMYQRDGKAAYKANLDNTHKLMDLLDHPYQQFKSIHVGGTNGKGSTSHMLASILQENGYKVGLYTSPHLKDFRERIRINGEMISEKEVIRFVDQHRVEFEKIDLSFFEWTVGLCFSFFAAQKVDYAIIEVGMGGRLDSTNVISPVLSIITNIGLDHTQFLGDTKTKIAREKAGIIKPKTPVVIGSSLPDTKPVFSEVARLNNLPISFAEELKQTELFPSDLKGEYQIENQKTVLAALPYLKKSGCAISSSSIENGLKRVVTNTGLMGRWHVLSDHPYTVCDTAHNEDGLTSVLKQILKLKFKQAHYVIGMVSDKDVTQLLKLFPTDGRYYFCSPKIPRALNASLLAKYAKDAGLKGNVFESVSAALGSARDAAHIEDFIYIGGSTFVVAEVV
ncbi:MAG: bifunctional folylpolyglutamate synthase/dihydrofolate synthase [Flavobacteriales bacterium]|nr:bifunctional folylpolyglutamate synthase/dihydrofolate synthase [Flavobacteriales bacterium]